MGALGVACRVSRYVDGCEVGPSCYCAKQSSRSRSMRASFAYAAWFGEKKLRYL